MRKLILALIISLFFILPLALEVTANAQSPGSMLPMDQYTMLKLKQKIDPAVEVEMASLQGDEQITVIVTLATQADLSQIPGGDRSARLQGIVRALQAFSNAKQKQIAAYLTVQEAQGNVSDLTQFWIFNGVSVSASQEVIQALSSREDVARITPDKINVETVSTLALASAEPNLTVIQAPALWSLGYQGQGIVVANLDSGVDASHPDLASNYRGGSNSWYDPFGEHPITPTDISGHGTWTMGVMVGGETGGTAIGVAPQAEWVAAKIFNDSGSSTSTAIHLANQWLLDPDGDPGTDDAPHVVNNSWTFSAPGCNLEFEIDLKSLRAAGILPVFAAGNGGPSSNTSYSPGNNPSAIAIGATDNTGGIYAYSSRGPTDCGGSARVFPDLTAPGVGIVTADLGSTYTTATGTSLAAPHVSGGLALLLSAFPGLSADYQATALMLTGFDLGAAGEDNDFGYGRLDLHSAYDWLTLNPEPTPTPAPTSDPSINLAMNQPVIVSSEKGASFGGGMAVDGSLATLWQSAKSSRKNGLPSEWIQVDLGVETQVGRVALVWDSFFSTDYTIQLSSDGGNWSTVFATNAGDGGSDEITFATITARYIRLDTTGWANNTWRIALAELEVYSGSSSQPTPTPTPTPTLTPTSTPSPTPSPTSTPGPVESIHLGDLSIESVSAPRNRWIAQITFLVHDDLDQPVVNVTVSGHWSDGVSGSGFCVTDDSGVCTISKSNIKANVSSVQFMIDELTHTDYTYLPSANHNSNGEIIDPFAIIFQP